MGATERGCGEGFALEAALMALVCMICLVRSSKNGSRRDLRKVCWVESRIYLYEYLSL